MIERSATVRWPFKEEEISKWEEWIPDRMARWYAENRKDEAEREEIMNNENLSHYEAKYRLTHGRRVTIDSKNAFEDWFITKVMPKTAKLMKKIIQLVSSSSFQEALKRVKGGSYAPGR